VTEAILKVLEWINDIVLGMTTESGSLTGTLDGFIPQLYTYTDLVMKNVIQPVAYTILALFLVLELYKISTRVEGIGGSPSNLGAEVVVRVLFKLVVCKVVIDQIPMILNVIYNTTTSITRGVAGVVGGGNISGMDLSALESSIEALSFWNGLICLILCFVVFLFTLIAVVFANIIISARFIELYVYFAISPIPVSTLPSDEMSQIGKNFLKNFAAVCIQGTLIFIVLSFYPHLFPANLFSYSTALGIFSALMGILGYSLVLVICIFATNKWSKSICNAM